MANFKLIIALLIISTAFVDGRARRKRRQLSSSYYGQSQYPYSNSYPGTGSMYGAQYGTGMSNYGSVNSPYGTPYGYNAYGSSYGYNNPSAYGSTYNNLYPYGGSSVNGPYGYGTNMQGYPNTGLNTNYGYGSSGLGSNYGYGTSGLNSGYGYGTSGYNSGYGYGNSYPYNSNYQGISNPWYRASRKGDAQGRSGSTSDAKVNSNVVGSKKVASVDKPSS